MASRKAAVASLPALLLIGVLLLVMAGPGAVSDEEAASGQQFHPASLDRAPEPSLSPKNSRAVRAGRPVVVSTSLDDGALPSAPETMGSATVLPEEPAPAPPEDQDGDNQFYWFILIILVLCCICDL